MPIRSPLLTLLILCSVLAPAPAHIGPLRRLLGPRPKCNTVPLACCVTKPEPWGTLEGRVLFKGKPPDPGSLEKVIQHHSDRSVALMAPKEMLFDPTWRVDSITKGVANVCVYLKRPANGILPIHEVDKVRKEPIVMDSPFCVYLPHMVAVYPEWFDGNNRGKTGQQLIVKNSSPISVGNRIVGHNDGYGRNFPPTGESAADLKPKRLPYPIQCDIHPWMKAYAWSFDHPYFAITNADGSFAISRVPAGMDVQVMAWHESQGWLFGKNGKTITLKAGKNTLDIEMK